MMRGGSAVSLDAWWAVDLLMRVGQQILTQAAVSQWWGWARGR